MAFYMRSLFLALATATAFVLGGCADPGVQEPVTDVEPAEPDVERTSPDVDVEVTPDGEAEVDIEPEVSPGEGLSEEP